MTIDKRITYLIIKYSYRTDINADIKIINIEMITVYLIFINLGFPILCLIIFCMK